MCNGLVIWLAASAACWQAAGATLFEGTAVMPVYPSTEIHGANGGVLSASEFDWPCRVTRIEGDRLWLDLRNTEGWIRREDTLPVLAAIASYTARLGEAAERPEDAHWLRLRADSYTTFESHRSAAHDYLHAYKLSPSESRFAIAAVVCCLNAQQYQIAVAICDYLINKRQRLGDAHFLRGSAKAELQDLSGALLDLDQALLADPENVDAYQWRGTVWLALGNPDKALEDLTRADLAPTARICEIRALAYVAKSDYERAVFCIREGLTIDPKSEYLALLHAGFEALAETAPLPDASVGDPSLMAEARGYTRAAWADAEGRDADVIATVSEEIESESTRLPLLLAYRANAYRRQGKTTLALSDAEQAVKLQPSSVTTWEARGRCRLAVGDVDGAIQDFECAIEIDPTSVEVYLGLSDAYLKRRDLGKSYAALERLPVSELGSARVQLSRALLHLHEHAPELAVRDCTNAIARLQREKPPSPKLTIGGGRMQFGWNDLLSSERGRKLGLARAYGYRACAELYLGNYGNALADGWRFATIAPAMR